MSFLGLGGGAAQGSGGVNPERMEMAMAECVTMHSYRSNSPSNTCVARTDSTWSLTSSTSLCRQSPSSIYSDFRNSDTSGQDMSRKVH
jgi:hypothetical protein